MPTRRLAEASPSSLDRIRASLDEARDAGRGALPEPLAKQVLARYGLSVPRGAFVGGRGDEADALRRTSEALRGLAAPFVLKVVAPGVLHKTDVGGVRLGLRDASEVVAAMRGMANALRPRGVKPDGFLVEETAPAGQELVIGGFRDASFGPVVMLGAGGVFVELLQDVSFRICPITRRDAEEMLDELKVAAILRGARGGPSIDPTALFDALIAVGGENGLLMELSDALAELDVNPLIVGASGAVAVDARMVPARNRSAAGAHPSPARGPVSFGALFEPRSIAVVGASGKGTGQGNTFIRCLRTAGFAGAIYPIHPVERELEGLPAYRDLASTPEPIDYAFVAIPAPQVPTLLAGARGRVRIAQVMSSGFDEEVDGVDPLDGRLISRRESLQRAVARGGMRLLGPNCMGTHSPRGHMSFIDEGVEAPGCVGVLSQSGGLSIDIIRRGRHRGLRFSGVVSIGNCLDLDPGDLLGHFLEDPQTRVIGAYVEHLHDGRRFFELLRRSGSAKPVVLLKGGRSAQGQRAAASHTGSLLGNDSVWSALAAQTGAILVDDLDAFIDTLTAFQANANSPSGPTAALRADPPGHAIGSQVIMFGNGGGASVLAADALARRGVQIGPLLPATSDALKALDVPSGASLDNPIDVPANILQRENGALAERILRTVCRHESPNALIVHLNLPVILGYRHVDMLGDMVRAVIRVRNELPRHVPLILVLRSSGEPKYEEKRLYWAAEATREGIAVMGDLSAAAQALSAVLSHLRHRAARERAEAR
ncbi:MAG: acetate--CoA ligase family protein [Burkholderiaceae bacterium]|nr:acetate--CoA ligase family protein [Burkholderiaceae bacterium]